MPGDMVPNQVAMMPNPNKTTMMHLGPSAVNIPQQVCFLATPNSILFILKKLFAPYFGFCRPRIT